MCRSWEDQKLEGIMIGEEKGESKAKIQQTRKKYLKKIL